MADEELKPAVGTGTDTLEIQQIDPNSTRKLLMAKYAAVKTAEMEDDLENVPGAKEMQQGYEQGEGAEIPDGDTVGEVAVQAPRAPTPVAEEPPPGVDSAPQRTRKPKGDENVTLLVFGKEVVEPRSVVEAHGGVEARRIQLAVEHRFKQAEELAQRDESLRQVAADKRRQYEEKLREMTNPGRAQEIPAPASTQARPAAPAQAAGIDALVANAVTELYSGDPDRASVALSEVLRTRSGGQVIDAGQISALVQAKVEADLAARDAKSASTAQVSAVNELMESKYAVVLQDPVLRAAAATMYNTAVKDPRNAGRPLVRIADEIGAQVLQRVGGAVSVPDADINAQVNTRTNFKRRIPQASSASDRVAPAPAEEKFPTKPSDVINLYRSARGQPLQ
jgi:hypothetical protein